MSDYAKINQFKNEVNVIHKNINLLLRISQLDHLDYTTWHHDWTQLANRLTSQIKHLDVYMLVYHSYIKIGRKLNYKQFNDLRDQLSSQIKSIAEIDEMDLNSRNKIRMFIEMTTTMATSYLKYEAILRHVIRRAVFEEAEGMHRIS